MTEKSYGGNNGVREHVGGKVKDKSSSKLIHNKIKTPTKKAVSSIKSNENFLKNNQNTR